MIHIKFYKSDDLIHMDMQGHAGTAEKGKDLVCAAATMLVYTLAQAVQFLYEQGRLEEKPKIQIEDGYAFVSASPNGDSLAETLMVFWVSQVGAYVLEHNYPQAVCLMPMEVSA